MLWGGARSHTRVQLCDLGLYIGINGCGLRTDELLEMVAAIPLDKLVVETDAPWCGIKNSHASSKHVKTKFPQVKKEKFVVGSMVKDRNEPAKVVEVVEVIASVKGVAVSVVAEATYKNTIDVLFSGAGRHGNDGRHVNHTTPPLESKKD